MTSPTTSQLPAHVSEAFEHSHISPLLVVDLEVVADRAVALQNAFPTFRSFYAVKANPMPEVLELLVALGSQFDVASPEEIDLCIKAGAPPESMSFGNTIKKRSAITYAAALGINQFAFDSEHELEKLVSLAPGSLVMCRVLCPGEGAAWPLSRKFGCTPDEALRLLTIAGAAGMRLGIAMHVGSQQSNTDAWNPALQMTRSLADSLASEGYGLEVVNLGGGFPGTYRDATPDISEYATRIQAAIDTSFRGSVTPQFFIEPGRYLVADAGTLQAEVVTVGRKDSTDLKTWVFLDVGIFQGLFEATDEAIQYEITTQRDGDPVHAVVLAGPTCDSVDVLYEKADYALPHTLTDGDWVRFHGTGAYTASYSSVAFNGFPPLQAIAVGRPTLPTANEPTKGH